MGVGLAFPSEVLDGLQGAVEGSGGRRSMVGSVLRWCRFADRLARADKGAGVRELFLEYEGV